MLPSQVRGSTDESLINLTLGDFFDEIADLYAERRALVVPFQGIDWSYAQLHERVTALAASFCRLGLQPGARVGIWSQNCYEWVITQFATAKAGLVLVNINPAYRADELAYSLTKVGCAALIMSARFKRSDYRTILQEALPKIELRHVILIGPERDPAMIPFDDLLTAPRAADLERLRELGGTLHANDPINIQFTSGTTGSPKGATLSHRNLLNNGYFVGEAMRLSADDRVCIPVPLYHCFGMVIGNLACITHGAAMVFPSEGFDTVAVLQTIEDYRCTALHGVPTMFIALLENPEFERYNLTSLRTGVMAGAPCPIEVMKRVVERMHMTEVTIAYGMTETAPISFQSSLSDPVERRVASVGVIQPHLEVKIVDEQGQVVPRGTAGELLTRGYSVMLGYWNDPERTRESLDSDGWMHTGDLATLDENGYCNIVGRLKDMVIRGGENIFPREIEDFLYRHPKVQDVQVVGVPDARFGEELCACIILRPGTTATPTEIKQFFGTQIAHFKVPRYVRFMDEFPMTVTGKIPKYLLRRQIAADMGLTERKTA